jgi:hypothetical protein
MTTARLFVAGVTLAVLAGLMGWQIQRERLIRACVDGGGLWHGARSECIRPLLQRDYRRSGGAPGAVRTCRRDRARDR